MFHRVTKAGSNAEKNHNLCYENLWNKSIAKSTVLRWILYALRWANNDKSLFTTEGYVSHNSYFSLIFVILQLSGGRRW
jgi:hypothetical protein